MDALLGDPRDPANPYGFAAMVTRDAVESFPAALAARLAPRLALSAVPAEHGGDLSAVDETLMVARVAARRDVAVTPVALQLHQWARGYRPCPDEFAAAAELARIFGLDAPLPPLQLGGLQIFGRGRDAVTAGLLPRTAAQIRAVLAAGDRTALRVAALEMAIDDLRRDVLSGRKQLGPSFGGSVELLDLAGSSGWLSAVLGLMMDRAHGGTARCDAADTRAVLGLATRLHAAGRLFSAVPLQLAEGVAAPGQEAS